MTRSASVKYTTVEVRVTPDLAPVWVNSVAGNGATDDNRPPVSRMMRPLYRFHTSGRWSFGSHWPNSSRNEKIRSSGARFLLVASSAADEGVETVLLCGLEQDQRLNPVTGAVRLLTRHAAGSRPEHSRPAAPALLGHHPVPELEHLRKFGPVSTAVGPGTATEPRKASVLDRGLLVANGRRSRRWCG
jgi:hypothetical protein